ncbi:hypothetical protein PISMIDRAFT_677223 [Pisolithus microcarpus 441]|uniref:Uncharacterized protein n=1 Tax=Pisolithus microcarpus 441 TaxID=765257 RepID=A0A0C9ZTJ9_9AGAM|nr:hypothetical protein PISMIDRAFT_677223 [Pisolithus microcarpus 441]
MVWKETYTATITRSVENLGNVTKRVSGSKSSPPHKSQPILLASTSYVNHSL